jgi:hypothetical protein
MIVCVCVCVYEGGGRGWWSFCLPCRVAPSLAQLYVCVLDIENVSMCPEGGWSVCMWVCVSMVIISNKEERACVFMRTRSKRRE